MDRREMKKEIYWLIRIKLFSEQHATEDEIMSGIEHLQPGGKLTEAGERRFWSVVSEIIDELSRKAGA